MLDQQPGQFLVVDKPSASNGVFEVPFEGILWVEDRVVAALHHAGAAALANLALGDNHDIQTGVFPVGVQGRHQPGSTAADNQNVRVHSFLHAFLDCACRRTVPFLPVRSHNIGEIRRGSNLPQAGFFQWNHPYGMFSEPRERRGPLDGLASSGPVDI